VKPRVSVIVPARDARATLPRTLRAIAEQDLDDDYEVIVVDDGSRDGTAAIARTAPRAVRLLRQEPAGPAAARNLGAGEARGNALAFCDADVYPTRGWLRAGLGALEEAQLVQGMVLPDPDAELGSFDRTIWVTRLTSLWEAANLFVTRELFARLGGFSEGIRPMRGKPLAEDVWFGHLARRRGARVAFCPAALAHHAVFERGPVAYVSERWRRRFFPAVVAAAPELRATFLHKRWFLDERSARFDLALLAGGVAFAAHTPLPLLAILPYVRLLRGQARRRHQGPLSTAGVASVDLAADVISLAAMAYGSTQAGAVVL
jgi:glycosyltransferase involved in cell wall biosynthesis